MADKKVRDIVQVAAAGDWNIPEFQREFEWIPEKIATLCDSLYRELPIGGLTIWNTTKYNESQRSPVTGRKPLWIVDGQQRVTTFCILAGKKPNWMDGNEWKNILDKSRIYLNILENGEATIGRLSRVAILTIPLDELISEEAGKAYRNVQEKCAAAGILNSGDAADKAANVSRIIEQAVPVTELGDNKAVEDVADVYRRLNQQGTRLREAQMMLAYVSQDNPGWVREQFYPFLESLADKDEWELDPAHVLQVATVLAEGRARVGQASPGMWQTKIKQVWPNLSDSINEVLLQLFERGITDDKIVPSSYTFITLFAMHAKFRKFPNYDFEKVFRWFVLANLSARYSDAPLEQLSRDGSQIYKASSVDEVLNELRISWKKEDFQKLLVGQPFRDNSSQALLLHLVLWSLKVKDWVEGLSIPTLTQAPKKMEPHWHHILPKAWGKKYKYPDYNQTANVTRLCSKTNVRKLSSKPPWEYVPENGIPKEMLTDHLISIAYADKFIKGQLLSIDEFKGFLKDREQMLVEQGVALLSS